MANLSLQHITKVYDNKALAVSDFNMEIEDKEFIVFVGPSGCGKSTTLRMIAGLEEITGGDLYIDGKRVNDVEPKDRDIAMVFQNYALYPHKTVYQNMAFALRMRKVPKDEIKRRILPIISIENQRRCPVANGNVLLWAAQSFVSRKSFCSMNRSPIWMPSCEQLCVPKSRSCIRNCRPPLSMLPTTRWKL